jgi:RNA polymerase sigma-70 factor (ECF subfamily)
MSSLRPPPTLDTEALFLQYAAFVASFLARLGVAPGDLDDVLQEVFLVVHARGGYVEGPAKPSSYLGAIAVRAAASYRRRRATSLTRCTDVHPEQLGTAELDPMNAFALGEAARTLYAALAKLEPELCATLMLVDHEGESPTSVAASMGVAVATVYWRLHQARKMLRKLLAQSEARGSRPSLTKREAL